MPPATTFHNLTVRSAEPVTSEWSSAKTVSNATTQTHVAVRQTNDMLKAVASCHVESVPRAKPLVCAETVAAVRDRDSEEHSNTCGTFAMRNLPKLGKTQGYNTIPARRSAPTSQQRQGVETALTAQKVSHRIPRCRKSHHVCVVQRHVILSYVSREAPPSLPTTKSSWTPPASASAR